MSANPLLEAATAPEAAYDPARDLAAAVCAAFSVVLQRDDVAETDDFFDLGGDSILAVALCVELTRSTGHDCNVVDIYDAPTPAELSALVARGPAPRPRGATRLRAAAPGNELPPLFIVHGIDGLITTFPMLANGVVDGRAIYGIEAAGLDGGEAPLERIEDMAARYTEAVRQIVPAGPYILAGYSFGGLAAFEMARRLAADGTAVQQLILIDTLPHPDSWSAPTRALTHLRLLAAQAAPRHLYRLAKYGVRRMRTAARDGGMADLARLAGKALATPFQVSRAGFAARMAERAESGPSVTLPALARVNAACVRAYRAYRPGHFDGDIDIVQATVMDFLPCPPERVWRRHAARVAVRIVPGGHLGLVREQAAATAAALAAFLQRAPHAA